MMVSAKSIPLLLLVVAVSIVGVIDAFYFPLSSRSVPSSTQLCSSSSSSSNDSSRGKNGKTKFGQRTVSEASRFLSDFRSANGEIIDPYKSLRVPRGATPDDIKTSYRKLSRKLHPDAVSKSRILPGNCANLDEVREEWEKVKLSYEILSDPKARKSYDRNSSVAEVLEDPTGAVGRAVVSGAFTAVGMGFGAMWKVGELAVKAVTAQPPSPPVRKEITNNVHKKKTQTGVVESEAPTPKENNVDANNEAKVWTIEEMRAAASAAVAAKIGSNSAVSSNVTETTLDSKKADTPIITHRGEEPSASTAAADTSKKSTPNANEDSKKEPSATVRITFDSTKPGTPIRIKEPSQPDSDTAFEIKAVSNRTDEADEEIKMITPEPLTLTTTKNRTHKPKKQKTKAGRGFQKK
jgi:hypothetical protein